jgi:glutaconate CoA-transferase subunit A
MTIEEAVGVIRNGDTVILGGWGASRKPMAIARQIARSDLKDLTLITMGGIDADLLIAAKKVKKVVYGFLGYASMPGMPGNLRRARQDCSVEMVELSEGMSIVGLRAAADRLPFLPTRSGLGTDLLTVNSFIKTFACPYTGETLVAMPALNGDVAFLHVNAATSSGYGQIIGEPWLDRIMVRAAKRTILSAERIVLLDELRKDFRTIEILRPWVYGVVEVPYGAHPTGCYPDYDVDQEKVAEYTRASGSLDSSAEYLKRCVMEIEKQCDYIDLMGGTARLSKLRCSIAKE